MREELPKNQLDSSNTNSKNVFNTTELRGVTEK